MSTPKRDSYRGDSGLGPVGVGRGGGGMPSLSTCSGLDEPYECRDNGGR